MKINMKTVKPPQSCCIEFDPATIVVQPGQTEVHFKYTVKEGAVSGMIEFYLDPTYKNLYYIETNELNFEVLEKDVDPPEIIQIYLHNLQRTKAFFRISTDESVVIHTLLTLKGTIQPPKEEIFNKTLRVERKTRTDVYELHANNETNQSKVTRTFIYHDTFFYFDNLEE